MDEIRALFERRMRIEGVYPGARLEGGPHTVRTIDPERGCVIHSSLDGLSPAGIDAVIEGELARFRELGLLGKLEWKLFGCDRPPELLGRLEAHGFVPREPADAILVLELAELPEDLASTRGHDIRLMPGTSGLPDLLSVARQIWPEEAEDNELFERWLRGAIEADPEAMSVYVAYVDGQAVAEGRIDFADSLFAGLWGGATLPGYRNRGIYSALVAARAAEAIARGCRFLTIDASPMSRAVLEKRGFRLMDTALECNYKGS